MTSQLLPSLAAAANRPIDSFEEAIDLFYDVQGDLSSYETTDFLPDE
jgi:hypothetical protein